MRVRVIVALCVAVSVGVPVACGSGSSTPAGPSGVDASSAGADGPTAPRADGAVPSSDGGASGSDVALDADAGGFSPAQLPGLVQWLAPSSIIAPAGTLTSWDDLSAQHNDEQAGSAAQAPSVDKAAANGLDAVKLAYPPSQVLARVDANGLGALGTGDFLVEIVARVTQNPGAVEQLWAAYGNGSTSQSDLEIRVDGPPDSGDVLSVITKDVAGKVALSSSPVGASDGAFHVISARRAAGKIALRVDGTAEATATNASDLSGIERGPLVGNAGIGDIAEVVVVAGAISSADLAQLDAYLRQKYATP